MAFCRIFRKSSVFIRNERWLRNPYSTQNDNVTSEVINRNPRNLEQLRIEIKPQGWKMDMGSRKFWNKLILQDLTKEIIVKVVHNTGKTVVEASSLEWAIRKHLYSATDLCALENVARVLAQRCLRSGLQYVHAQFKPEDAKKEKIQLLISTLEKEGLCLQEPPSIDPTLETVPFKKYKTDIVDEDV